MTTNAQPVTPLGAFEDLLFQCESMGRASHTSSVIDQAHRALRDLAPRLAAADEMAEVLRLVAEFAESNPWTGLGDSKGYGVHLPTKVAAALAAYAKARGGGR